MHHSDNSKTSLKSPIYRRVDTGEEMITRDAPAGAMWRATWLEKVVGFFGVDGQSWIVKTPGGDWAIDTQASNCTRKDDLVHKCWCRHGVAPDFTIDKSGETCQAGAGSIMIGNYHGFLRGGYLESC